MHWQHTCPFCCKLLPFVVNEDVYTFVNQLLQNLAYNFLTSLDNPSRQSFTVAAPVVWNSLLAHLRSPLIRRWQFWAGLKTHLFKQAYSLWEQHSKKQLKKTSYPGVVYSIQAPGPHEPGYRQAGSPVTCRQLKANAGTVHTFGLKTSTTSVHRRLPAVWEFRSSTSVSVYDRQRWRCCQGWC